MSQQHNATDSDRFIPRFLTPKQVAQQLQIPVSTVQKYAQTGVLPAIQVGKHWRFPIEALDSYLKAKV